MITEHEISIIFFIIIFLTEYKDAKRHCVDIHDGCMRIGKSRPISRCYRKHVAGQCCKTCQSFRNQITPECPYGDKQEWCKTIGKEYSISVCYEKESICCKSCPSLKIDIPGCEYGDRILWCQNIGKFYNKSQCLGRENSTCCQTCHQRNIHFSQAGLDEEKIESNISILNDKSHMNQNSMNYFPISALQNNSNHNISYDNYNSSDGKTFPVVSTTIANFKSSINSTASKKSNNNQIKGSSSKKNFRKTEFSRKAGASIKTTSSKLSNGAPKSSNDVSNFIDFDSSESSNHKTDSDYENDYKPNSISSRFYYTSDDEDLMTYGSGMMSFERNHNMHGYKILNSVETKDIKISPGDSYEVSKKNSSNKLLENVTYLLYIILYTHISLLFSF